MTAVPAWQRRALENSTAVRRSRARVLDVSQQLIDTARVLYYEGGTPFTISRLAEAAGVSVQTFYRCFPGKEELLLALFQDTVERNAGPIRAGASSIGDPVVRLRYLVRESICSARSDPYSGMVVREHLRLAAEYPATIARIADWMRELVTETIKQGVAAGTLVSAEPSSDARLIADGIRITVHHLVLGVTEGCPEEVAEHFCRFCLAALGHRA